MAWTQPKCEGKVPQERRYHSASVIDEKLLIFGGQYYDATADLHFECDNALCIYHLQTNTWTSLGVDAATPLRRACHAAGVVGKRVYLIGGRYWDVAEDDYIFLNDVQILSTQPTSTLAKDWSVRCTRTALLLAGALFLGSSATGLGIRAECADALIALCCLCSCRRCSSTTIISLTSRYASKAGLCMLIA